VPSEPHELPVAPAAANTPEPPAAPAGDSSRKDMKRLQLFAWSLLGWLLLVALGAVAVMVALIDEPRTDDLQQLGVVAAAAGLAGGSLGAVYELQARVAAGFRLGSGGFVLLDPLDRRQYEQSRRRFEHEWDAYDRALSEYQANSAAGTAATRSPPLEPFEPPEPTYLFSSATITEVLVYQLTGAVLGVVVFAGVLGGFLVATASDATFNPAALAFMAFLGGLFAYKLLGRLSAAADVLFGNPDAQQSATPSPTPDGRSEP
jgi:hypothetical protein